MIRSARLALVSLGAWLSLCTCFAAARPNTAWGQERTVLVPVVLSTSTAAKRVSASELSGPLETELHAQGQNALFNVDAAALFELRHSFEPVKLDESELTRLLRTVRKASRHLALGDLPLAQQTMEEVYALSGPARDFLNRETARARKLFDTCLMTAYLWQREDNPQQALKQMLECARNFPGFRPEGHAYPPELRALFEQAKTQLSSQPATHLLIRSKTGTKCGVRLNGIEVGDSPLQFDDAHDGVARVQLECKPGVAGRIHSLEPAVGTTELIIDPEFDAAAHTRRGLWLSYADEAQRSARLLADLRELEHALGDSVRVMALSVDDASPPNQLDVHVYATKSARELAMIHYDLGDPGDAGVAGVQSAASAADSGSGHNDDTGSVGAGHGYDARALTALARKLWPSPQAAEQLSPIALNGSVQGAAPTAVPASRTRDGHQHPVLASVLTVAGAAGVVTGWVLYAKRYDHRTTTIDIQNSPEVIEATSRPQAAWTLLSSGLGALALSAAEPLWLPEADGVPWPAWVAGGLGAGIALTGAGFSLFGPTCSELETDRFDPNCSQFPADSVFGPMLMFNALPLLAAPLTYVTRGWLKRRAVDVAWSMETDPRGTVVLSLHGAF